MSNSIVRCRTRTAYIPRPENKPGTGGSLHTQEPVTVASFRTWRGWREYVARDRCLTGYFSICKHLRLACSRMHLALAPPQPAQDAQPACDFRCRNSAARPSLLVMFV